MNASPLIKTVGGATFGACNAENQRLFSVIAGVSGEEALQHASLLINSVKLGKRMDFDPEILVRLAWRNQPMRWLPTQVHYPRDGLSHFRLFHDNALISGMHTKLFFGMLLRLPSILWRRCKA